MVERLTMEKYGVMNIKISKLFCIHITLGESGSIKSNSWIMFANMDITVSITIKIFSEMNYP